MAGDARIVLVSGPPGAGKTTLARPLAKALGFALLSKDDIKEPLFDALGGVRGDAEATQRFGAASWEVLWALILGFGLSAVVQAEAKLDAAIAAMPSSGDPVASIDAARRVVGDYASFANAYEVATHAYAPVKRSAFAAIDSRAQAMGNATIAFSAAAPRPWLFASQARKQAYRLLQDNSARARASMAQLDHLSRTISSSSDLGALNAAVAQASRVRQELSGLYAASSAARSVP